MKYIMSLDQGTTSSRCIIFNEKAEIVSLAQKEFKQYYPQPGWVEHDPFEILESQLYVAKEALKSAGLGATDIASIGITNQRETTVVWDKNTGIPYGRAIVWQCRRTAEYCKELRDKGAEELIRSKTGLLLDPYFSGTKVRWILDNIPEAKKAALRGDALFGTVDSWLIWNLSGKRAHVTDVTNASRTLLFNIHDLCWDKELLSVFDIPESMLPRIVDSSGSICYTDPSLFGAGILISGVAGDQQSAMFGQGCFDKGSCKNTYGTGCFLLMNTGREASVSHSGLLTTVAWKIGDNTTYAGEGSVFIGGAAIQWLRDEMKLINASPDSEFEALQVKDSGGVYVVPAFTGLGAPYWDPDARGIITGITRGTERRHIIRATLESIAYQVQDVIALMKSETGCDISTLNVDGGASKNNLLMQFQADISNITVRRSACTETTALGAALLSGLASGVFGSIDEIKGILSAERSFAPQIDKATRTSLLDGWHDAVSRCKSK